MHQLQSPSLFAIGGLIVSLLYFLYRRALPRPIPGIPYNKNATKSILGDVPEFLGFVKKSEGEAARWWVEQCIKHNTPIMQLFLRPFSKPMVVLCDFRESQDIMLRRTKEFDRSDFFEDIFGGTLPYHHINQKTTEQMKSQKRLLADTMMPAFLNEVATPRLYEAMLDLVRLWNIKADLAQGHPFAAGEDVAHAALDAIWIVTLGQTAKTIETQAVMLEELRGLDFESDEDKAVEFPHAPRPPAFDAVLTLCDAMEPMITSPFPRIHHWFLRQLSSFKNAQKYKNQAIDSMMKQALKKFSEQHTETLETQGKDRSVIDHMIRRELLAARKEQREPQYNTPIARDEVFGFLIAGYETTSTTVAWGLKLLTDNQQAQSKLREVLRSTYADATAEERQPSAQEIARLHHPYIDGTLEEIVRLSQTSPAQSRCAMVDTQILGFPIPKGTDVSFMTFGGYVAPPTAPVDENRRSASSRAAKDKTGTWDLTDIGAFKPERWLRVGEDGTTEFNKTSGPSMQFGAGVRGCFGKRLAYIELRMLIVFTIWNFELLPTPKELSSYRAVDRITHQPKQCYVRLKKAEF